MSSKRRGLRCRLGFHAWVFHKPVCAGFDFYRCSRCGGYGESWWDYWGRDGIAWKGMEEPDSNCWGQKPKS